jgi:allantoicase
MMEKKNLPAFTNLVDLAAERLGGKALLCSDDFFAEKENLLKPGRGIFIPDKYTDRGKWMDGWESRRKREAGYDWCIVQLATSGKIRGFDIDTNHFLGNHPPHASIDAINTYSSNVKDLENAAWKEILQISSLEPGAQNFFEIADDNIYTHVRLNIYPDGGVARLKVYGEVARDWDMIDANEVLDLGAAVNGARPVVCNDMFFSHMENLLMPGRGLNMGDGWETKRNRTPGNRDWVIIQLAHEGSIDKIVVDTCHFKGNYPDRCVLEGCNIEINNENEIHRPGILWKTILGESRLRADHEHFFEEEILDKGPFTHVRLSIFPDGGISRLRLWGRIK